MIPLSLSQAWGAQFCHHKNSHRQHASWWKHLHSRNTLLASPWADFWLSHPTGFMRNIHNWIWNECGIVARAVGMLFALFCHRAGELSLSGEVARPSWHSFPQSPGNEDATSELIRRWSILNFLENVSVWVRIVNTPFLHAMRYPHRQGYGTVLPGSQQGF